MVSVQTKYLHITFCAVLLLVEVTYSKEIKKTFDTGTLVNEEISICTASYDDNTIPGYETENGTTTVCSFAYHGEERKNETYDVFEVLGEYNWMEYDEYLGPALVYIGQFENQDVSICQIEVSNNSISGMFNNEQHTCHVGYDGQEYQRSRNVYVLINLNIYNELGLAPPAEAFGNQSAEPFNLVTILLFAIFVNLALPHRVY